MTYGRVYSASQICHVGGADVSHLAELVKGDFLSSVQGPLIRPLWAPSPQGEKGHVGAVGVQQ